MDSFLPRFSTLFSLVCEYTVWFSPCAVVFFGRVKGMDPLSFLAPSSFPFLAEVCPFTNPHKGNISISSPSTINPRQTPLLALAPERETFPPPLSLPSKLLSRWMLVALPCLFPSPVPARGEQRAQSRGFHEAGAAAQSRTL